jgi:hypothetical protein
MLHVNVAWIANDFPGFVLRVLRFDINFTFFWAFIMPRKSEFYQGYFFSSFSRTQSSGSEGCRSWARRAGAIAKTLSIAASAAAVIGVAPAQATELRPASAERAKSISLDTAETLELAAGSENTAPAELRTASKFASATLQPAPLQPVSFQPAPPQPAPALTADAQLASNAPAEPPVLEPLPQPSAQVLLNESAADESTLAQNASEPPADLADDLSDDLSDELPEGDLEPTQLPELEPAELPEGEFETEGELEPADSFEAVPPDSSVSGESRSRSRWEFTVEPYFFIPLDVEADITALGRSATIRADLGDILNLDRAFDGGLRVDARNGRFGILLDGFYLSAAQSGTLPVTFPAGSLTRFGIPFEVEARADASASLRQGKIDLAAYYRVVNTSLRRSPTPANPFPLLVVDPILGLRTNISRQEIEVDEVRIGPNTIPIDREFSDSRTTLEPLVGLRVALQLSPRWSLGLESSVSGFDVNAERDTTWNFQSGVGYSFSRSVTLRVAYVYNSYRFRDGEGLRRSEVDLDQQGIGLWLSIRF